jgi:hypothetical protein
MLGCVVQQESEQAGGQKAFTTDAMMNDPVGALSKGWSIFSTHAGAAISMLAEKANENIVTPAITAAKDPELQNNIKSYWTTVTGKVREGSAKASQYVTGDAPMRPGGGYDSVFSEEDPASKEGLLNEKSPEKHNWETNDDDWAKF